MKFEMSEENSKRFLSGTKLITDVGQNYLASLNNTKPTSSGKKLINALLLVPIIVPTAITALSFVFTMLFLNAVNASENDSKLSKVAKGVARVLIHVVATVVLIPCIILNLIISLIPFLIFRAINKDMFSQKNIEDKSVNKVEISNDEEYNKRVEEEVNKLGQQDNMEQNQPNADYQPLIRSDQLYNQPTIEIISRVGEDKQTVDETVTIKNINNDGIRDGEAVVRIVGDDRNFTTFGVFTGNATNKQEGFATAARFSCNIVENGIDFQLDCSTRIGNNKQEATQALIQSKPAQAFLSSNGGILSIEQFGSSQQKK